jgi:hypothetical protein
VSQQQSSGQPHEASQQPSSQQGSEQQPHDFSQQHEGSQASQPHPLPSIRSNKPAAKPWLVRQRLNTSAPKTFHLIEPHLLCMGATKRDDLTRRRGARRPIPGGSCRGDRSGGGGVAARGVFGAGAERPALAPGSQGGASRVVDPKGRRPRRSSQSMARIERPAVTHKHMCRSDTSRAWHATSVVSVARNRPLEKPEVIFSKCLRATIALTLRSKKARPRAPVVAWRRVLTTWIADPKLGMLERT